MNRGYICQPCDKVFSGEAPYQDHIVSEKHQRKIKSLKIGDSLQSIENYRDFNLDEHIQICGSEFKCTVCNCSMCDISMAVSHVKGQKHLKVISRLSSPGSSPASTMELDPNIQKSGTEYICKPCKVFMNDISIVSSHLKGQKHLKTLSKINQLDPNTSLSDLVANVSENTESENELGQFIEKKGTGYVCNACIIVIENLSVALNHAKGPAHLKSIAQMDKSIDLKNNVAFFNKASSGLNSSHSSAPSSDIAPNCSGLKRELDHYIERKGMEYVCNACNVSMNDISIVSSHLKGQKHLKTLFKLGNSDSVPESPNCVDLKGQLDETIVKKGFIYICNACNAIMNDISTATSHARGQKHLKSISKLKHSENHASDGDITLQSPDRNAFDSVVDSPQNLNHQAFKLDQFIERCGNEYKCNVCNVAMNDISTAACHVRGQKHTKTVSVLNSPKSPNDSAIAFNASESSYSSNDSDHSINSNASIGSPDHVMSDTLKYDSCIQKLENDFLCRPCNVLMNGDSTVRSHLLGQKHLKNKLMYSGPTNVTDDKKRTSFNSSDTDDMYLVNNNFSLSVHTIDEVLHDVKVVKTNEPVIF